MDVVEVIDAFDVPLEKLRYNLNDGTPVFRVLRAFVELSLDESDLNLLGQEKIDSIVHEFFKNIDFLTVNSEELFPSNNMHRDVSLTCCFLQKYIAAMISKKEQCKACIPVLSKCNKTLKNAIFYESLMLNYENFLDPSSTISDILADSAIVLYVNRESSNFDSTGVWDLDGVASEMHVTSNCYVEHIRIKKKLKSLVPSILEKEFTLTSELENELNFIEIEFKTLKDNYQSKKFIFTNFVSVSKNDLEKPLFDNITCEKANPLYLVQNILLELEKSSEFFRVILSSIKFFTDQRKQYEIFAKNYLDFVSTIELNKTEMNSVSYSFYLKFNSIKYIVEKMSSSVLVNQEKMLDMFLAFFKKYQDVLSMLENYGPEFYEFNDYRNCVLENFAVTAESSLKIIFEMAQSLYNFLKTIFSCIQQDPSANMGMSFSFVIVFVTSMQKYVSKFVSFQDLMKTKIRLYNYKVLGSLFKEILADCRSKVSCSHKFLNDCLNYFQSNPANETKFCTITTLFVKAFDDFLVSIFAKEWEADKCARTFKYFETLVTSSDNNLDEYQYSMLCPILEKSEESDFSLFYTVSLTAHILEYDQEKIQEFDLNQQYVISCVGNYNKPLNMIFEYNKNNEQVLLFVQKFGKVFLGWSNDLFQTFFDFKLLVSSKSDLLLANLCHYITFYNKWTILLVRLLKCFAVIEPFLNENAFKFANNLLITHYDHYMQSMSLIQMLVHCYFNGKLHQDWVNRFTKGENFDILDTFEGITSVDILEEEVIDTSDLTAVSIAILAYLSKNIELFDDVIHLAMKKKTKIDSEIIYLNQVFEFMESIGDSYEILKSTIKDANDKLQLLSVQLLAVNEKKAQILFYQSIIEVAYHSFERISNKDCSRRRMLKNLVIMQETKDLLPEDSLFTKLKELLDMNIAELSESNDISRRSLEITCQLDSIGPVLKALKTSVQSLLDQKLNTLVRDSVFNSIESISNNGGLVNSKEILTNFDESCGTNSSKKMVFCLKDDLNFIESALNTLRDRIVDFDSFILDLQSFNNDTLKKIANSDDRILNLVSSVCNKILPKSLDALVKTHDEIKTDVEVIKDELDIFYNKFKIVSLKSDPKICLIWKELLDTQTKNIERLLQSLDKSKEDLFKRMKVAKKFYKDLLSNEEKVVALEKMSEQLCSRINGEDSDTTLKNDNLKNIRSLLDKCKIENARLDEELLELVASHDLISDSSDFDQLKSATSCLKTCTANVQRDIDFVLKKHISELVLSNRGDAVKSIEEMRSEISKKVEYIIENVSNAHTQSCIDDFKRMVKSLKNDAFVLEKECKIYKSLCELVDEGKIDNSVERIFDMIDIVNREVLKVRRIFKYQEEISESYVNEYEEHIDEVQKLTTELSDLLLLKQGSSDLFNNIDTFDLKKQIEKLKACQESLLEPLKEQENIQLTNNDSKEIMETLQDGMSKLEELAKKVVESVVFKPRDKEIIFNELDSICSDLSILESKINLNTGNLDLEYAKQSLLSLNRLLSTQRNLFENIETDYSNKYNQAFIVIDDCEEKIAKLKTILDEKMYETDSVSSIDVTCDDEFVLSDFVNFGNFWKEFTDKDHKQCDLDALIIDDHLATQLVDKLTATGNDKKELRNAHESFWVCFKRWGARELKADVSLNTKLLDSFEAWLRNIETLHNKFELNVNKQKRYSDRDLSYLKKEIKRLNIELKDRSAFQEQATHFYNVNGYKYPTDGDRFQKLNSKFYKLRESINFMHYFLKKYTGSIHRLEEKIDTFDKLLDSIEVPKFCQPVDYSEFGNLQDNQRKSSELIKHMEGKLKSLHYELNTESRNLFSTDKTLGNKGLRLKLNLLEKKFNRIRSFAERSYSRLNNLVQSTAYDLGKMDEFSKELSLREAESKRFVEFDYSFMYAADERIALEHARFLSNLLKLRKEYNHIIVRHKYMPIRNNNSASFSNIANKHLTRWENLYKEVKSCTPFYNQLKKNSFDKKASKSLNWPVWRDGFIRNLKSKNLKIKDLWPKDMSGKGFAKLSEGRFISTLASTEYSELYVGIHELFEQSSRNGRNVDYDDFLELINGKDEKPVLKTNNPKDEAAYIASHLDSIMIGCTCDIPFVIKRVDKDKIVVGPKKKLMLLRLMRCKVMARVGGGWVELNEHLSKLDPCRSLKKNNDNVDSPMNIKTENVDDLFIKAFEVINKSSSSVSSDHL